MAIKGYPNAGVALKAFAAGNASSEQQLLAYRFIINGVCAKNDPDGLVPADAGTMGWWAGRRWVATIIEDYVRKPIKFKESAE